MAYQEEIKRDLAKEKEIERGRSSTRRSNYRKSRSKSSYNVKRKDNLEDSDADPPSPNYTIYKEGGQGYTKYTVYTKNKEDRVEENRVEKMK